MRYILDTDWIINFLAGKPDAAAKLERLDSKEIVISLVTVGEIYESAYHFANPAAHITKFREFIDHFELLNLNLPIIERFAEIRAHLRRRGQMISDVDILLGATALHHNLTVLTYNRKHFTRIPDLKVYPA